MWAGLRSPPRDHSSVSHMRAAARALTVAAACSMRAARSITPSASAAEISAGSKPEAKATVALSSSARFSHIRPPPVSTRRLPGKCLSLYRTHVRSVKHLSGGGFADLPARSRSASGTMCAFVALPIERAKSVDQEQILRARRHVSRNGGHGGAVLCASLHQSALIQVLDRSVRFSHGQQGTTVGTQQEAGQDVEGEAGGKEGEESRAVEARRLTPRTCLFSGGKAASDVPVPPRSGRDRRGGPIDEGVLGVPRHPWLRVRRTHLRD